MVALSEMIKSLQDENNFLKIENNRIKNSPTKNKSSVNEEELHAIIINYQRKAKEMTEKINELETRLETFKEEEVRSNEKSKYKPLARKLKEERNMFKDMSEKVTKENKILKEEIEKMKQMAEKLKAQCKNLKHDLSIKKNKTKSTEEATTQTENTKEEKEKDFNPLNNEPSKAVDDGPEIFIESPETEDEEKTKLDEDLSEFLNNSLNVTVDEKFKEC